MGGCGLNSGAKGVEGGDFVLGGGGWRGGTGKW